jgi:tellurite resistance protein TerC
MEKASIIMISERIMLVVFTVAVLILLVLDLFVFHRKNDAIRVKSALLWSAFWISLSLLFNLLIYHLYGQEKALNFLTGYLIEEALSVDNLFVFLIIFKYFRVSGEYQRKVLFWGILGALMMRAVFIAAGVTLVTRFHFIIYIFGAFLIYTGIKMFTHDEEEVSPERNIVLRIFRKFFRVTKDFRKDRFFVKEHGRLSATPLFVVLLVIESTDVVFALDSIPAVLAITTDPFIVYTSNICAILGLRALYFALAGIMNAFQYLNYGLSAILVFVGFKMLASDYLKIDVSVALGIVGGLLLIAILASIFFPAKRKKS